MTKSNTIHNNKSIAILCWMTSGHGWFHLPVILLLFLNAFVPPADAGCACSNAGNWDPYAFLNSDMGSSQTTQTSGAQAKATGNSQSTPQKPVDRLASYPNNAIFKPMKSVSSSDVVIDVSNGNSYTANHIKKAVHIPAQDFLNSEVNLKTAKELAKILVDAGVSRDDLVVLYGSKESSGEAEFVFLVLRYLGQQDVKLLDGSLADWKASGLPVETTESKRPSIDYKPEVKSKLVVDYEHVKSGQAQILDARPFVEFGKGRIPGSVPLDPANIIKEDKIKNGEDLSYIFNKLNKEEPIVVYSSDYSRSSLVWYALQLMGYEASIYTWEDWKAHQATTNEIVPVQVDAPSSNSKYTKLGRT